MRKTRFRVIDKDLNPITDWHDTSGAALDAAVRAFDSRLVWRRKEKLVAWQSMKIEGYQLQECPKP